jgi:hypothetical protein
MTTTNDGDTPTVERTGDGVIRINTDLNPRLILLPAVGATTGLSVGNAESFCVVTIYLIIIRRLLGFIRGSREAGLQFLAENAHRQPTTVRGWYFYNKTKNYQMIWSGLKMGGRDAVSLCLSVIGSVFILYCRRRLVQSVCYGRESKKRSLDTESVSNLSRRRLPASGRPWYSAQSLDWAAGMVGEP